MADIDREPVLFCSQNCRARGMCVCVCVYVCVALYSWRTMAAGTHSLAIRMDGVCVVVLETAVCEWRQRAIRNYGLFSNL